MVKINSRKMNQSSSLKQYPLFNIKKLSQFKEILKFEHLTTIC
jgi:hypothetical protein